MTRGREVCLCFTRMAQVEAGTWRPAIGWGVRLREARRSYGKARDRTAGQREFAELVGVKEGTYEAWESGRNEPPFARMVEIADRLQELIGLDRSYLLDRQQAVGKPWYAAGDSNPEPSDSRHGTWLLRRVPIPSPN